MTDKIDQAIETLARGGVILYPTETVYGLGCDPFNKKAVLRLLKIKKRIMSKGLILIAADLKQISALVSIDLKQYPQVNARQNRPTTWLMPASQKVPKWIRGKFKSVAIRITTHRIAKNICKKFGGPIVSTSANFSNKSPQSKLRRVDRRILLKVGCAIEGRISSCNKPSQIVDLMTGKVFRK